jgi:hypothetical protein
VCRALVSIIIIANLMQVSPTKDLYQCSTWKPRDHNVDPGHRTARAGALHGRSERSQWLIVATVKQKSHRFSWGGEWDIWSKEHLRKPRTKKAIRCRESVRRRNATRDTAI